MPAQSSSRRRWRSRRRLALLTSLGALLVGAPRADAELLEVRQLASGMECPECARNLRLLVNAVEGVEESTASWNRRVLTVQLKPGNHVTLAQLRALVVKQHFRVCEAEIVVAGRLDVDEQRQASLLVPESNLRYRIDSRSKRASDWIHAMGARASMQVVVTGRVAPAADPTRPDDPLVLWALDFRAASSPAAGR